MFADNTELNEWVAPDCNGENFFNVHNSRVIEEFGQQYAPLHQRVEEVINDIRAEDRRPPLS